MARRSSPVPVPVPLLERLQQDPALLERVLRLSDSATPAPASVRSPADAVALFEPMLAGESVEVFAVAALDRRMRVLRTTVLTRGCDTHTLIDVRQVFAWALRQGSSGAHAILCAHNHPSGDPTPSSADVSATRRLVTAGNTVGVMVQDHVVLADGPHGTVWSSLRQEGVLE